MNRRTIVLGVIGGSGLYDLPDIEKVRTHQPTTPFGSPSGPIVEGKLKGKTLFFLPRHGIGHVLSPSRVPYRANIYALKSLGVNAILSFSAVGSLKEEIAPGHLVVPDQVIDRTHGVRPSTFFEEGLVVHVAMGDPFCTSFRERVIKAARSVGVTVHDRGTLVVMEGPHFSTRAESFLYRSWGAALVGMTTLPEAKLAREASLCYATLALATDYDCWHETSESVTVEAVLEVMNRNIVSARKTLLALVDDLSPWECTCPTALKGAIVTQKGAIDPATVAKLALLLDSIRPFG